MREFFGAVVPFLNLLGLRGDRARDGHTEVSIEVRPDLTNHFQGVHGGVVATVLDAAMASAARTLNPDTLGAATVSLTVNYVSAPGAGTLTARGRVRQSGRSLVFCDAEALDATGRLVATAVGTFKLRRDPAPHAGGG